MPTTLDTLKSRFRRRLATLDSAFDRRVVSSTVSRRVDRSALQEGLVSSLWQTWCYFCRDLVITSTIGTKTSNGANTTSALAGRTEAEVAFAAMRLAHSRPIGNIRPIAGDHLEPTWGNLNKLSLIVTGLAPSNKQEILTATGACVLLRDLQLCRNSSAHISKDSIRDIRSASVRYTSPKFEHPSDIIFWIDPDTQDYVWKTWIDEAELFSDFAIL